jgi:hypothetical protein
VGDGLGVGEGLGLGDGLALGLAVGLGLVDGVGVGSPAPAGEPGRSATRPTMAPRSSTTRIVEAREDERGAGEIRVAMTLES